MRHYPKLETDAPIDGNRYVRKDAEWEVGTGNMIAGQAVPPDSLGEDGDYYVNYTTLIIYHKSGGVWGGAKSLITGLLE